MERFRASKAQECEIARQRQLRLEAERKKDSARSRPSPGHEAAVLEARRSAAFIFRQKQLTAPSRSLAAEAELVLTLDQSQALGKAIHGRHTAKTAEAAIAVGNA